MSPGKGQGTVTHTRLAGLGPTHFTQQRESFQFKVHTDLNYPRIHCMKNSRLPEIHVFLFVLHSVACKDHENPQEHLNPNERSQTSERQMNTKASRR